MSWKELNTWQHFINSWRFRTPNDGLKGNACSVCGSWRWFEDHRVQSTVVFKIIVREERWGKVCFMFSFCLCNWVFVFTLMQKVIHTKFNNESMMFDSNINYWNDISMLKLKLSVCFNHPLIVIPQTNISYKQRCFKSTVLSGTLLCKYYLGCTYQTDAIPSPNIFWLHRISMFWAQHSSNWCVSTR